MRSCQRCGEPNAGDSKFCVSCGEPLTAAATSVSPRAGGVAAGAGARDEFAAARPLGATQEPGAYATTALPIPASGVAPLVVPDGAPAILVGFLTSFELNPLGDSWRIDQGRVVIGRQGSASAELEIPHPTVSSSHAELLASAEPGRVQIVDKGSTNGTYINEVLLQPGVCAELRDGDQLRFGLFGSLIKII